LAAGGFLLPLTKRSETTGESLLAYDEAGQQFRWEEDIPVELVTALVVDSSKDRLDKGGEDDGIFPTEIRRLPSFSRS
jgi:hypothetical protein